MSARISSSSNSSNPVDTGANDLNTNTNINTTSAADDNSSSSQHALMTSSSLTAPTHDGDNVEGSTESTEKAFHQTTTTTTTPTPTTTSTKPAAVDPVTMTTTSTTVTTNTTTTTSATLTTFPKALVLLCGIVNFGFSFGFPTSLSVFFLDWQGSFHESRAFTATIHATCVGTLSTGAIIPGLLMGRVGARATLLIGCFLAFAGLVLSCFATGVGYLMVTTGVIFGLGCCMINLPTIPCITSVFTTHQSIVIASLCFGAGVLNTVLPFVYRFLSEEFGWRGSMIIIAALILQTCASSLVITSFTSSSSSSSSSQTSTTTNGGHCDHDNLLQGEATDHNNHKSSTADVDVNVNEKQLALTLAPPKTNYLLQGISLTSLHNSSIFGSQMLVPAVRSRSSSHKSMGLGVGSSRESIPRHSTKSGLLLVHPDDNTGSSSLLEIDKKKKNEEEEEDDEDRKKTKNSFVANLRSNHPYLFDALFIVEVLASSFCLGAVYATIALMMDFAKAKGFHDKSTSVFFVFIAFLHSIFSKILTGSLNLIPAVHSVYLLCFYSCLCSVSLFAVDYIYNYYALCVVFSVMGFTLGGIACIYPKCVLDMKTVEERTYPVALGLNNSLLGVFDCCLPIFMGYTVDTFQSYSVALHVYGSISGFLAIALILTFSYKTLSQRVGVCGPRGQ